jgi:hypothetical protein
MPPEEEETIELPLASLAALYIALRTMDHPDWVVREARIERAIATLPWPVRSRVVVAAAAALRRRIGLSDHG